MRKIKNLVNEKTMNVMLKGEVMLRKLKTSIKTPLKNNDGWGRDEIIGAAIILVIAAFVVAPELTDIVENIMSDAATWFDTTMGKIFSSTAY